MGHFENSIQYSDGKYHVGWPWKTNNVELPDNYELSCGRLQSVSKRLKKSPEILKKYNDFEVLKYSLEQYIGFVGRQAFNYYCSLHQV